MYIVCLIIGIAWMIFVRLLDLSPWLLAMSAIPFSVVLVSAIEVFEHFDAANFPSHFE